MARLNLSENLAVGLRRLYATGAYTYADLAKLFELSSAYIGRVIRGELFPDAGGPIKTAEGPIKTGGSPGPSGALSDDEVLEIRRAYATGDVKQVELAERFGVSPGIIGYTVRGEAYGHVGGPIVGTDYARVSHPSANRVLSATEVRTLRRRYCDGQPQSALAHDYGISQSLVSKIVRGHQYTDVGGPIVGQDDTS
jgi:transposase-like protein